MNIILFGCVTCVSMLFEEITMNYEGLKMCTIRKRSFQYFVIGKSPNISLHD